LRRTITTLNRFTTFITSWWANPRLFLSLAILVLLSCEDETSTVGFKNPSRDFEVFAREFTIPTRTFLMDSVNTSYGNIAVTSAGTYTTFSPARFLCGSIDDPHFGKSTAVAYTPYWYGSGDEFDSFAVFESLTLTLVMDYYWYGDQGSSNQKFEVHALTDSMITYRPHYISESVPYGQLLGETAHIVDPTAFEQNIQANLNLDGNTADDITDSLFFTLDPTFGKSLFALAQDTLSDNETKIIYFSKFRRLFKGFAITSPNSNKIVGIDPSHAKTRMTLNYRIDTTHYQLYFYFSPPGQAPGTAEYMAYTQITTERSGTALAAMPAKYEDFEPADGMRYVQAGTGVGLKLDFTEVLNHFKDIPIKSLSVAEMRIESEQQTNAPLAFKLRALRYNNRFRPTSMDTTNIAADPIRIVDVNFAVKHLINSSFANFPYFLAEATGDDGQLFALKQIQNSSGSAVYLGYLTNFLEQELSLEEKDHVKYWALIPQTPDISRGVNGFYFPADKIKLKIYYTAPRVDN